MTLSELRTNLPLRLVSMHVRDHHDKKCDFDLHSRPAQLNVLADHLATDALMDLRAAAKLLSSIRCPSTESIFVIAPGIYKP
jgi:hypothetical protein